MLIDAHCHIQAEEFNDDRDAVIERCRSRGMTCVVVGNRLEDSQSAVTLAETHEGLFACVGLHPMFVTDEEWDQEAFTKLLQHPRVVGVGEVGLDYYRLWADSKEEELAAKKTQKDLFLKQIALARKHKKPVVIHCRDAYDDLMRIVKNVRDVPMMIHTFLGDANAARAFLDLGIVLSFSGIVTFEDEEPVVEAVKIVPLKQMMIETDSPHLAPVPFRGQRNEPIHVEEVARKIAEIKNVSVDEVINTTSDNARAFFGLP
ncbi:MAG: TatD family hydrolase [bacterium]